MVLTFAPFIEGNNVSLLVSISVRGIVSFGKISSFWRAKG